MARTMSATEARAGLPKILEMVTEGEEVTITLRGKAVAVVVRPDALKVRRAEAASLVADSVRQLLDDAGKRPLDSGPGISAGRADELIEHIRAGRAAR